MNHPHLASLVLNQPLLITPHKLDVIMSVLKDKLNLDVPEARGPISAVPQRSYEVLDGGVAVIPVVGTLVHRSMGLEALSMLTSYSQVAEQFNTALADSKIREIVFDLDTPGGAVNGLFDFVDQIFSARGEKSITAIVNESAYSAGYAIASAADQIIIPRTGGAGSIGVIAKHTDFSQANEKEGIKVTTIYAGDRKNDGNPDEPLSDEARATLQGIVNETYELFVHTVARNRGMSVKDVRGTDAGIFMGRSAVKARLADRLASADDAISSITQEAVTMSEQTTQAGANNPALKGESGPEAIMPKAKSEAEIINFEEKLREAADTASAKAISAERERIGEIHAMCAAIRKPDYAAALIASGVNPEKARAELFDKLANGEMAIDSSHGATNAQTTQAEIDATWVTAMQAVGIQLKGN